MENVLAPAHSTFREDFDEDTLNGCEEPLKKKQKAEVSLPLENTLADIEPIDLNGEALEILDTELASTKSNQDDTDFLLESLLRL